jgi:DNA-binding response OmpR family regulator
MSEGLIVDDDPAIREIVAEHLTCRGYDVQTATNGEEALRHLDARQPAAIIVDVMMPIMDGWSFLWLCREKTSGARIPTVVISAEGEGSPPNDIEQAGAHTDLTKPFDLDELAGAVTDVIHLRSAIASTSRGARLATSQAMKSRKTVRLLESGAASWLANRASASY